MTTQLQTRQSETFSLTPKTLEEAMKYSEMLAKSSIVPKNYQGKAGDILVAVQMGNELGLKPIQSLQNIAVINGKPCIYGDACMALVKIHPEFEDVKEHFDEQLQAAVCQVKRRGQTLHTSTFTIEDAKKAGLWNRQGPWMQYPKRMLQMRARGFALRDAFPDALQGLILAEEAQDYKDVSPDSAAIGEAKTYASTTDKLIDRLGGAEQAQITEEAVVANSATTHDDAHTPEIMIEPEVQVSPAEQLTMLIGEKAVPIEVMQKWLAKAGVSKLSDMSEGELMKCIAYVHEKY